MTPSAPDLLAAIVSSVRRGLEARRRREPPAALERRASQGRPRGTLFSAAIAKEGRRNVIAECKRRSPSRGVLRASYDPAAIARAYERHGACAISVLTEPSFFDGSLEHLRAVRSAVALPVLRKDFLVDEYQILEARADGADAVLLIVSALDPSRLRTLVAFAEELGLAALVEVHDEVELRRATEAGAAIIGINSRNLRTLDVDTRRCDALLPSVPSGIIAVAESGLRAAAEIDRLRQAGCHGFLVGERLMTAPDPGLALTELLSERSTSCG